MITVIVVVIALVVVVVVTVVVKVVVLVVVFVSYSGDRWLMAGGRDLCNTPPRLNCGQDAMSRLWRAGERGLVFGVQGGLRETGQNTTKHDRNCENMCKWDGKGQDMIGQDRKRHDTYYRIEWNSTG
ncbi:hypothetical protein E2C01_099465 [Portunus trituberculatus]|uniref:Uncharacterized protein n=1 Tax=Portunus trituberculatus TaxID=210409 RepID=A0A5B7K3W7_PORTR|nr:hypothetical protein [Portunus trituberculatus]